MYSSLAVIPWTVIDPRNHWSDVILSSRLGQSSYLQWEAEQAAFLDILRFFLNINWRLLDWFIACDNVLSFDWILFNLWFFCTYQYDIFLTHLQVSFSRSSICQKQLGQRSFMFDLITTEMTKWTTRKHWIHTNLDRWNLWVTIHNNYLDSGTELLTTDSHWRARRGRDDCVALTSHLRTFLPDLPHLTTDNHTAFYESATKAVIVFYYHCEQRVIIVNTV